MLPDLFRFSNMKAKILQKVEVLIDILKRNMSHCLIINKLFYISKKNESMGNQLIKVVLITFSIIFSTSIIKAQDDIIETGAEFVGNPIQTAVPFLRISPEAKAGGMGDVGMATRPDANAVHWNSAKIPFTKTDNGITLAYTPWLAGLVDDVYMMAAGGYHKLDSLNSLNFGIKYFNLGQTEFRRTQFDDAILSNPQEFAIQGGYSRRLSDVTGLGVNLKYINSDLATGQQSDGVLIKTGTAVAGDLNFFFAPEFGGDKADWNFGVGISNLGSKISYLENSEQKDFLPTNFGIGANVDLHLADTLSKVSFALDANKLLVPTPQDRSDTSFRDESVIGALFTSWVDAPGGFSEELKEWQLSVGGEYDYNEQFYARAGYFYENKEKGNRNYATLGAGLKWNMTNFNFSYLFSTAGSNSPLNKTLRFSVEFDF